MATDEMSNDLEWMLQRYPMSCPAIDALTAAAASYRASQARLFALLAAPPAPSQFDMTLPPREYQALATGIYLEQKFLLVGDVVGLGKTVVAIASLTDKRTLPACGRVRPRMARRFRSS